MDEKTIGKQLRKILADNSGAVMPDELKEVFDVLLDLMKEMKVYLESEMTKGDESSMQMCKDMMSEMSAMEEKMGEMVKHEMSMNEMNKMNEMKKTLKSFMAELETIKHTIPTMPDLMPIKAELARIEASIPEIKEEIKETPQETRDKLESIKTESEKLDIESIGYLREELDKLKKIRSTGKSYSLFGGGGGSSGGGRTVQAYDITSQLNGVLKSFTLPAFWRVISVHSSSFPYVFRPTTDYTISGTTITFTDEIEASTTLSTLQTLVVIYTE